VSYRDMPLAEQLEVTTTEMANRETLANKARVYTDAADELFEAGRSVGAATDRVEPSWPDEMGEGFVLRARGGRRQLDLWAARIESARPQVAIQAVLEQISVAHHTVTLNKARADELNGTLYPNRQAAEAAGAEILRLQQEAGDTLDELGRRYTTAAGAVEAATSGADWTQEIGELSAGDGGATAAGGGGGGGAADALAADTTAADTMAADAAATDTMATDAAATDTMAADTTAANAANTTGTDTTAGAGGGATAAGTAPSGSAAAGGGGVPAGLEPALAGGLSGGGTAPALPPTVPASVPPLSGTPVPGGGGPLVPPLIPAAATPSTGGSPTPAQSAAMAAARAGGFSALGAGGGVGGAARVPGVSLGGPAAIPAAATPVSSPTAPTAGTAPGGPGGGVPVAGQGGTGTAGGIPPMVPPMAGGAAGGRGGGPVPPGTRGAGGIPPMMPPAGGGGPYGGGAGSGATRGPYRDRRRRDEQPPGLPVVLTGKAGLADPFGLAPVRPLRHSPEDTRVTVELIDEDLWKVDEQAPEPVVAPTPPPVRARR
jgi:hypothetical protein